MKNTFCLLLLSLFLLYSPPSSAEQYLSGGVGWFDITESGADSAEFAAEWRGNPFFYGLLPVVGGFVNTDGGVYGYGGLKYDWEFAPNWYLLPGAVAGAWSRGDSAHLGGTIEFQESLELGYQFDNNYRLGAQISHMSNADIYDHNPGQETLLATFSIPLGN